MGRPNFGQPIAHPAPLAAHALHDDDVDVDFGDIAEGVHDGLPAEATVNPEPALPLGFR